MVNRGRGYYRQGSKFPSRSSSNSSQGSYASPPQSSCSPNPNYSNRKNPQYARRAGQQSASYNNGGCTPAPISHAGESCKAANSNGSCDSSSNAADAVNVKESQPPQAMTKERPRLEVTKDCSTTSDENSVGGDTPSDLTWGNPSSGSAQSTDTDSTAMQPNNGISNKVPPGQCTTGNHPTRAEPSQQRSMNQPTLTQKTQLERHSRTPNDCNEQERYHTRHIENTPYSSGQRDNQKDEDQTATSDDHGQCGEGDKPMTGIHETDDNCLSPAIKMKRNFKGQTHSPPPRRRQRTRMSSKEPSTTQKIVSDCKSFFQRFFGNEDNDAGSDEDAVQDTCARKQREKKKRGQEDMDRSVGTSIAAGTNASPVESSQPNLVIIKNINVYVQQSRRQSEERSTLPQSGCRQERRSSTDYDECGRKRRCSREERKDTKPRSDDRRTCKPWSLADWKRGTSEEDESDPSEEDTSEDTTDDCDCVYACAEKYWKRSPSPDKKRRKK